MPDLTSAVLAQIDALVQEYEPSVGINQSGHREYRGPDKQGARSRLIAAVHRLAPSGSTYVVDAEKANAKPMFEEFAVVRLMSVLTALRSDYAAGYMHTVEELVHADVFADFLEMADELVSKNFKDPAAVLAGSVLEEHLRKLAARSGVDIETPDGRPKKADTINADLAKVPVYNKTEAKAVTAWMGLRNDAAHGDYDKYDRAQVEALIRDVRAFMMRHPA